MFALTLPLLIAHGKFTKLDDMKDDEMEAFVSFLVKCDKKNNTTIQEPPWWLPNLPFVHPIKRPNKVTRKWRHKLKTLIKKCYKYYDYEILIDLSADLAHEQAKNNIKFVSKCTHLTSVFNKSKNILMVTIRNENMTYDLEYTKDINVQNFIHTRKLNRMCYNCRILNTYLIDEDKPKTKIGDLKASPPIVQDHEYTQNEFLQYFDLTSNENNSSVFVVNPKESVYRRINFTNAPYIPFSSQLGRRLATKVKYFVQDQTHLKRLDRVERYLNTPPLPIPHTEKVSTPRSVTRQKYLDHWMHTYKFPGKTYKSHMTNYSKGTGFLTSTCKPCYVKLTPIDDNVIKQSESDNIDIIDLTSEPDQIDAIESTNKMAVASNHVTVENDVSETKNMGKLKSSSEIVIPDVKFIETRKVKRRDRRKTRKYVKKIIPKSSRILRSRKVSKQKSINT